MVRLNVSAFAPMQPVCGTFLCQNKQHQEKNRLPCAAKKTGGQKYTKIAFSLVTNASLTNSVHVHVCRIDALINEPPREKTYILQ